MIESPYEPAIGLLNHIFVQVCRGLTHTVTLIGPPCLNIDL